MNNRERIHDLVNAYCLTRNVLRIPFVHSAQLAPVSSGGINVVDGPQFSLHCYETPTGLKFFVTARPKTQDVTTFLRKVYELYSDYVLKNPFYELDMPIRIKLFDSYLEAYVKSTGLGTGSGGPAATGPAAGGGSTPMFSGSTASSAAQPMFTGSASTAVK